MLPYTGIMDPEVHPDIELERQIGVQSMFSLFSIGFLLVFIVIDIVMKRYLVGGLLSLMLVVGSLNFLHLRKYKDIKGSGFFIISTFSVFSLTIFIEGGLAGSGMIWTFFMPVFAFHLLGIKPGRLLVIFYGIVLLLIQGGSLFSWYDMPYPPLYFGIAFGAYAAMCTFQGVYEHLRSQYALQAALYARKLTQANQELQELSSSDYLTGTRNRREISRRIQEELERHKRHGSPLSLMLLDMDLFKSVNDRYGHLVGDRVLKHAADVMGQQLRMLDTLGRFGGEEFCILLPGTRLHDAMPVAERIRAAIENQPYLTQDGTKIPLGVSIGLTSIEDGDTLTSILRRADIALYQAKDQGRNKVVST